MDKTLKNVIIAGIIIISLSIGYFILKSIPSKKTEFSACYEKCIEVGQTENKDRTCVNICGKN